MVRARIAFWEEYERAAKAHEKMELRHLYTGVCRAQVWWQLFQLYPAFPAWIVTPLAGYLLTRKELEYLGEERMLEIMSAPSTGPDGRVDARLAKVQFEIYQDLQDRIHGPVIQKVQSEQKNLNVNVNTEGSPEQVQLITNPDELARRLEEVRKKREALSAIHTPVQIDQQRLVQPVPEEK